MWREGLRYDATVLSILLHFPDLHMASLYDKNRQRKYLNAQERQQFKNCVDAITDKIQQVAYSLPYQ